MELNVYTKREAMKRCVAILKLLNEMENGNKERTMLIFTINDKQQVELTFDGEDKRLAELNAGNGATAQDVALGAVVVQALRLMNYKPRMELVNNLIRAKERKDK